MGWKKFIKNNKMIIFIILIVILILFFYPKTQIQYGCGCNEVCENCLGINYKGIDKEVCYGIPYDCAGSCTECNHISPENLKKMNQRIKIEEPKSGAIVIRNIGTYNINATELSIYINGVIQTCNWSAYVVEPVEVITADCTCTEGQIIKVTAPGNYYEESCVL